MAARIPQLDWESISPAPIVLVSGKEEYLASRAIARLRSLLTMEDPGTEVNVVGADEYGAGALQTLASPSLFGESRLIVVERVQSCNDAFLADALDYVAAPADGATLVLRHEGGVRGKRLLDAVRQTSGAIEVACAPITRDADRMAFARGEFRSEQRAVSPGALRALTEAFQADLAELAAACRQLIQDTTGEVTEQSASTYYSGRIETTAFDVADDVIRGDEAAALLRLRHALESGADPVPIVAAFAMRMRQLAKVSAAGGSEAAAAKQLGMAPWQVRNARRDLTGWSDARIGDAILTVAETDAAVKGFERDPVYAVERMVSRLARSR